MTEPMPGQRLTADRERRIREYYGDFADLAVVLAELDAVRAELGVERIVRDEAVRERNEALLALKDARTVTDAMVERAAAALWAWIHDGEGRPFSDESGAWRSDYLKAARRALTAALGGDT